MMTISINNISFAAPQPSCEELNGTSETTVVAPRADGSEGCVGLSQVVVEITQPQAAPEANYHKTVGVAAQTPESLAFTGGETDPLTILGLGAIAFGSILVRLSKRPAKHVAHI